MLLFIGIVGMLAVVLASFLSFRNFMFVLLAIKPFVDLTWNEALFQIGDFAINSLRVVGLIVFFRVGMEYLFRRNTTRIFNEGVVLVFFALLMVTSGLGVAMASAPAMGAINMFLRLADGYLIYFTCSRILSDEKDYRKTLALIWLSTLLVSFFSLALYSQGTYDIDVSQGVTRFAGIYNDPGGPSINAVMSTVFAALYIEDYKQRKKSIALLVGLAYVATFAVTLVMLAITLTKGAVVMFVIFLALWHGFYKRKTIIIIPLILIASYYFYVSSEDVQSRVANEVAIFTAEEFSIDLASRVGGGRVHTYIQLLSFYADEYNAFQKLFGTARSFGAHNQYIAFLLQMGLLGLTLFLVIVARFYRRSWYLYRRYRHPALYMAVVVLTMFVVASIPGAPFYYTTFLWDLMILLSMVNVSSYRGRPAVGGGATNVGNALRLA